MLPPKTTTSWQDIETNTDKHDITKHTNGKKKRAAGANTA